ncbi:MAG: hypothetical protein V1746_04575 [bacterium]
MKYQKAFMGPFLTKPFFNDKEMEQMCSDALKNAGLLPKEPSSIRIDRFIEKHFDLTEEYQPLEENILGYAKFDIKGLRKIVIAQSLGDDTSEVAQCRTRSTLAHEAGHGLCHTHLWIEKIMAERHQPSLWKDESQNGSIVRDGFMCRDSMITPSQAAAKSQWWEMQANLAMSCLLLPMKLLSQAAEPLIEDIRRSKGEERNVLIHDAERKLAKIFKVNPIMVQYRLQKWWEENALQGVLL